MVRTVVAIVMLCLVSGMACGRSLKVSGNRAVVDGHRGQILYRDTGDLDGDGARETVFAVVRYSDPCPLIVVARRIATGWNVTASTEDGYYELRTDVTDVNGDGREEIVARGISGDGHGWCRIYALRGNRLSRIGDFSDTKLRDLDRDGVPEILSVSMISFGFVGDHWLTIYRWNGQGWTDVSRRFPRAYDAVIRDLRRTIYRIRYTKDYGHPFGPSEHPDIFADLYFYLGRAYEYRGQPAKAREQYAIAYRLDPSDDEVVSAFRKTWGLKRDSPTKRH